MKEELEAQMSQANKLHDAGQFESARKIYLDLAEKDPQSIRILAGLGLTCMEMEALDEAVSVFKRAVELAPALESVSKGLFHSLWNFERRVEALEEIKRFQSISNSEDYEEIIKEINEKW
jgi:tetratricopeptide (TPR) repeat protein